MSSSGYDFTRRTKSWVVFPFENKKAWKRILNTIQDAKVVDSKSLVEFLSKVSYTKTEPDDFAILEYIFKKICTEDDQKVFFENTFPCILKLVLKTEEVFSEKEVPYLLERENGEVVFTQEECAIILGNALLSLWERDSSEKLWDMHGIPSINMDALFSPYRNPNPKVAKVLMIFNYFKRIAEKMPTGKVTIRRQFMEEPPNFKETKNKLSKITPYTDGAIENSKDAIQCDFANEFIGGSCLSTGAVQEEIRFFINPECIVSRLICPVMSNREAIVFEGVEQFSSYSGYASSLKYAGDFVDDNYTDSSKTQIKTSITAFDALVFIRDPESQWNEGKLDRETTKAYVAFYNGKKQKDDKLPNVATGNWGCGVFKGDRELKAVIQWIAASIAGRDVEYYTFGDKYLSEQIMQFQSLVQQKKPDLTTGELYDALTKVGRAFYENRNDRNPYPKTFEYLKSILNLQ